MLKKLLFIALFGFLATNLSAQETKFGVQAGYLNLNITANQGEIKASTNGSGFFIGLLADFQIADAFHIQPEANYGNVEDGNFLQIPVLAKYYIGDSNFNIMAGPQASFILDETGAENAFGLDIAFGAGYDINEHFFLQARYAFELTNRVSDVEGLPSDISAHINALNIGIGYKF